jgi:hypothetical protein
MQLGFYCIANLNNVTGGEVDTQFFEFQRDRLVVKRRLRAENNMRIGTNIYKIIFI